MQALRSKYFQVGQNLNTTSQLTAVTRPSQPVAKLTQHKLSTDVASQQHQNLDNAQLGKASYKKNSSVSPQFNHVMKDVTSSNASTRQPTPGINDGKTLFESSNLENFRAPKSKLAAQAGSKLDSDKAAPPHDSDWNSGKGYFGDSKPPVKANKNEHDHSTSKLPSLTRQPVPSWQTAAKPSNENKRTLYDPVSGKQRNAGKAGGYVNGAGEGNTTMASHQCTAAWARSKRESVEFEGLLADITLGGASGAVGNARKQPEGYVL